jgi:cell division protein FtsB
MSFDDNAQKASINPNKTTDYYIEKMYSKWPKKALDCLFVEIMEHVPTEDAFDKLCNPFLNGLKIFSSNNEVFCQKCGKPTKLSKNGRTKDTYQFICSESGKPHYLSAIQILETLPDEWVLNLMDMFDEGYKNQLLDWINKEHLSPEIWEVKGLKNATKRVSLQLSPVKDNSSKIRAVNHGLEEENRKLKEENAELSAEVRDLKRTMKALTEEVANLRKYLLENTKTATTNHENHGSEVKSFATVASIHKPTATRKPLKMTPLEVISKPTPMAAENGLKPYSPLKIYFFEGCHRRNPGIYRKMLSEAGFNHRQVRDITFLSDDIMQITAYESSIEELTNLLVGISDKVRRLEDFDPTKGDSYQKYGKFSDDEVRECYFAMMTKSAERLSKAAETVKALKRSANFLSKVIENRTVNYQSAPRKEKVFFLGSLIDYVKPARNESEMVVDTDAESSAKAEKDTTNPQ